MLDRSQQQLRARAAAESNRANRAASITTQPKRCGQDVASRPASATARPSVQRPRRTQSMKHPLQPASHSGYYVARAACRWREGGPFTTLDAVPTLRNAMTSTAPVRGRRDTARGPRGCPRRPGARRRRRRIEWRPPQRRAPRWPLSGAVLEVSPVPSRKRPTKSKRARNPKRNHPLPSFLETSRLDGVAPPDHRGTPSYDGPSSLKMLAAVLVIVMATAFPPAFGALNFVLLGELFPPVHQSNCRDASTAQSPADSLVDLRIGSRRR